jgi:hypothetical protein
VNASTVAAVISVLAAEPWMPRVSHWEIATTDETWGAHAELDCKTSGPAFRELHALAERVDSKVAEISDSLTAVDFVHDEVPVRVWWLRPALRWIVPETCATCPTKLSGEPGARFVRLGEGDREAPVICVPCRDRMQAEFVAAAREDVPVRRPEADRLQAQIDEMVHVAMGDRKVRLFDEVGEVRNARTIADAQLARANTLDRLCREKSARVAELEAERADREDDLAAALGRSGLDWTDLIDVATTAMRRAEGLDATDAAEVDRLTARVSVLEAERHSTNEALSDTAEALREKTQQLADAEQLRLTPLERLTLRFALELVDDAIANDPTDITDADRAAMDKLRALSTGPVVAYRNPNGGTWRSGTSCCASSTPGGDSMTETTIVPSPRAADAP